MTTEIDKQFKDRVETWLLKLEPSKWYSLPTENTDKIISVIQELNVAQDPYFLNPDKTKVCNIMEYRDAHWQEFKNIKPLEWVEIKNRADYEILVFNLKFFCDCKLSGEFDSDYSKFRWV